MNVCTALMTACTIDFAVSMNAQLARLVGVVIAGARRCAVAERVVCEADLIASSWASADGEPATRAA